MAARLVAAQVVLSVLMTMSIIAMALVVFAGWPVTFQLGTFGMVFGWWLVAYRGRIRWAWMTRRIFNWDAGRVTGVTVMTIGALIALSTPALDR